MNQDNIEKDYEIRMEKWLKEIYRGDKERELTFRGIFLGLIIGAILSLSNLYVGFKTGWSLGVTITASIMSFALFRILKKGLPFLFKEEAGILEINILQTTASACAFIASAGLVSAVPALLMVANKTLSNFFLILWVMTILYLGLFMAIPMKRQMIDVEDLKFPTGFATSEVLKGMFAKGEEALRKARLLFSSLGIGVVIAYLRDGIIGFPIFIKGKILKEMGVWQWKRLIPSLPATFGPSFKIMSIEASRLTLSFEGSLIMVGAGAIMGLRAGFSLLLGAIVGYGVLTPIAIHQGDITHEPPSLISKYSFKNDPKIFSHRDLILPIELRKGKQLAFEVEKNNGEKIFLKKTFNENIFLNKKEKLVEFLNCQLYEDGQPNPFYDFLNFYYEASINRLYVSGKQDVVSIKVLKDETELGFKEGTKSLKLLFPLTFEEGTSLGFKIGVAEGPHKELKEEELILSFKTKTIFENEESFLNFLNGEIIFDKEKNPFYEKISFEISKGTLKAKAKNLIKWDSKIESLGLDGNKILGFEENEKNIQKFGGFKNIVKWLMWPGVSMMVSAGLLNFFLQWKTVIRAFRGLKNLFKRKKKEEIESRTEIPPSWFLLGFLFFGFVAVILQIYLFEIKWWMGLIAVTMTFFLAIVACRATGETDITPVGAMGKITQLLYGAIAPGDMVANLMTANVTGGAATSSADLLQALKCGYRVGATPKRQFLAMIFGVLGGALICVPVYNILIPNADVIGTDKLPAPAAQTWAGVAILLSKGLKALPISARWGLLWGALSGIAITLLEKKFFKIKRFLPSPTAMGIAFVIPAFNSISMFIGSLIAYLLEKRNEQITENYTIPIASGLIAGESIMGIFIAILIAFQFM